MEAEKQQSKRKLMPARFKNEAHVVNQWSAVVEAETPFDDVKEPAFWSHIVKYVRGGDIIHVRADDNAYYARLYIISAAAQALQVTVLEHHDFSKLVTVADGDSEYRVEWAGPHHKFRIMRTKDNWVVQSGFDNKPSALAAMAGLARVKAA